MNGREILYLRPGMDEAELFWQFNARNPFYRHIAARLVKHVSRISGDDLGQVIDLLGRSGYCARAAQMLSQKITAVEHRAAFLSYLATEFAADKDVVVENATSVTFAAEGDTVLCCEQMSQLQQNYADAVAHIRSKGRVFAGTLGPSNHRFTSFKIADHRTGAVNPGEVMSELSHPIRQAVHAEVVRLAKARHGYQQDYCWPHAGNPFDLMEVRAANERAGFSNFVAVEEVFEVPGHQVYLYDQNGWTFYFRFPPLANLSADEKVSLLREAIETVRAMPEYDTWCEITAYHPVAYYIAW